MRVDLTQTVTWSEALRIPFALRSSAFSFCSLLISAAAFVVTPVFTLASISYRRWQIRSVSGLIPREYRPLPHGAEGLRGVMQRIRLEN